MAAATAHPTDQALRSYGLGRLDETSAVFISRHLESCADCRCRVAGISADSFLGRLRDVRVAPAVLVIDRPRPDGPPAKSRLGVDGHIPEVDGLPASLAEHPDYEIVRELGRGGMGTVYLAKNRLMDRLEVLKVVSSHLIKRAAIVDRFLGEIRNAARLHHANIVTAYSASRVGDSILFAMEYVEGLDLAQLVKAQGPLSVHEACHYVHQAALGLQHAHDHGMVHRDVNPSNLMLAHQGERAVVKVLDFGLAKVQSEGVVERGMTCEGQMLGTPDFIAPEQIRDARAADIRSDIYSLGCTFYYLLTGGPPFRATNLYELLQAHHSMDAPFLSIARPEIPVELAALVAKMMAKEPRRRFHTPAEIAKALVPFFKTTVSQSSLSGHDMSGVDPQTMPSQISLIARTPAQPLHRDQSPAQLEQEPTRKGGDNVFWQKLAGLNEPEQLVAREQPRFEKLKIWLATRSGPRSPLDLRSLAAGVVLLGLVAVWAAGVFRTTARERVITLNNPPEPSQAAERPLPAELPSSMTRRIEPDSSSFNAKNLPKPVSWHGSWRIEGDELVQMTTDRDTRLVFGDPSWSSYDLAFQAMSTEGSHGFKVLFHVKSQGEFCVFALGNYFNKAHDLSFVYNGRWGRHDKMWCPGRIEFDQWYDVRIEIRGEEFRCFFGDKLMFRDVDPRYQSGQVGFSTYDAVAHFRNISVTTPDGKTLWKGLPEPPSAVQDATRP